jgi:translation initiation factor IF-1
VEILPKQMFRVELANGHRVLAHLAPGLKTRCSGLGTGMIVVMKMSPFDFSRGCITGTTS